MVTKETLEQKSKKSTPVKQQDFPRISLEKALRIPQAIWDNFAGKGAAPHEIAIAIEMSPTSGPWRSLCGSAIAYGLTEGGYNASEIKLTALGRRIVAPVEEGDDIKAKVDAILRPRILREFLSKYDKAKFPMEQIGTNVLVSLGLPKDRAGHFFSILKANGEFAGVLRQTKTGLFVALGTPMPAVPGDTPEQEAPEAESLPSGLSSEIAGEPSHVDQGAGPTGPAQDSKPEVPKQLFVAHGKNVKPLTDLKKILDGFGVAYKVAKDEPHGGRPISAKVAELMRECSAGILIFTKDEKFADKDGNEIWRPSENVVYELGAASVLWDRKIIILREEGVKFPTDFDDLGYIAFEDGQILSKGMEILKELVGLRLLKLQVA